MEVIVREAKPDDAEAIAALVHRQTEKYVAPDFPPAAARSVLDSMTAERTRQRMGADYRYHVAEADGRIVGVVGVKENRHLYYLFVDDAHQRRGIGRRLWQAAMQACLMDGNPGEFTVNSSIYARPVYEKFGFVADSGPVDRNGVITVPMRLRVKIS